MKNNNRLVEIEKQIKIYRIAFIFLCILTTFIIIFGRDVLKILGLMIDKVDDSLGDYISSLLGALIGVSVTMSGTIFLERKETLKQEQEKVNEKEKEEEEKQARKKSDLRLLYFDLQMHFKELQENNFRNNFLAPLKNDIFYTDMNEIFGIGKVNKFDNFLSNHERAGIIIESELQEANKWTLLDFLSSSELRFAEKSDYDEYKEKFLYLYDECKKSYSTLYNFIKPLDYLLELEIGDPIFRTFRDQFNKYLGFYLKPFLLGTDEDKYGESCYSEEEKTYHEYQIYDCEEFTIKSLKKMISENKYKSIKINLVKEHDELDFSKIEYKQNFEKFCKENKNEISKEYFSYEDKIMKEISTTTEDLDDILRTIKNDYPDFAVEDGIDCFQENLIDNQNRMSKLYKLSDYISYTYDFRKYTPKGVKIELPKNPIKYTEKKYFNDRKILEFLDFKIVRTVIIPEEYATYLETVNNLKYELLPELFKLMEPISADNLEERYKSEEIRDICAVINEIEEKGEVKYKKVINKEEL